MSEYLQKYKERHKGYFKRNREFIKKSDWNLKSVKKYEVKYDSFKSENAIVDNIVKRVSVFIKGAEGDRHEKQVQKYIDEIVDVINMHLNKIEKYLETNIPDEKFKHKDKLQSEIKFQDFIFTEGIKIQEQLDKLNINNSTDNLVIKFYNDEKASLLLKQPLCSKNVDIETSVESLNVEWNINTSKEMLINMNKKDIPKWNPKKHFWEQDLSVIQFWNEEKVKCEQGLNINGYWIHPWLYWHLNIFKTPIPLKDGTEPTINPYFRDNEYFFIENVKAAEEERDKGLLLWGTRRFSKSVIIGSYVDFKAHTKFNSIATVTGGSEGDLSDLTDKIKSSIDYRHPAFKLDVLKSSWNSGDTKLGIRVTNTKTIDYSVIRVRNLSAGATKSTQKTAGGGPSAFVTDEIGKFPFLKSYLAALPSFKTPHGFKCLPILVGTAGESDLSDDAFSVLSNPEKYNMLLMNWDLLEKGIDPEYITWKRRVFGTFVPGQMSYEFPKIESNLGEYLNDENEDLKKVKIQLTDWKKAKELILEDRKKAKGDKLLLQQKTVQTPIDPEDSMMSAKNNPFPTDNIKKHKKRLESEFGEEGSGRKIELYREKNDPTKINFTLSNKELAEFPHNGGFIDAPFLLFGDFPETKPGSYRFVAGCLTPNQQVYTQRGLINVQDVNLTDKLINKEGKLVDIINLQRRYKEEEDIYTLRIGNTFRKTTFTKEHPIYIVRHDYYEEGISKGRVKNFKFNNPFFEKAAKLKKNDWIKYPNKYKEKNKFDVKDLWITKGYRKGSTIDNPINKEDFWYYIGLYLGDGYINNYVKSGYKITICFNKKENKSISDCENIIRSVFNREPEKRIKGNVVNITICCKQLYEFINKNFGQKSDKKIIPEWAKKVKKEHKLALICGYLNSDGCVVNDFKSKRVLSKFVSINLKMLEGIQDILFSLDIVSYVALLRGESIHEFPNGYSSKTKKTYMLTIQQNNTIKLIDSFNPKFIMKTYNKLIDIKDNRRGQNCMLSECNNYIYFRITDIEKEKYTGIVYNFECETNTFLCHHITTHNCDDYKHEESDGDSVGAFYIFDRLTRKIALSLATRPDPHSSLHTQIHLALDAYNAILFPENEDMEIKKYFDKLYMSDRYLGQGFDVMSQFHITTTGRRKYGWQPDKNTAPFVRGLVIDYFKKQTDIFDDLDNIVATEMGLERVEDLQLLEEAINYKQGGNFDRIVGFGSALLYDHYLTAKYIVPKKESSIKQDQKETKKIKPVRNRVFTNRNRGIF